jgi:hypothetical protein
MAGPMWFCFAAFTALAITLFMMRVQLEQQRARVEALYLEADEI